MWRDEIRRKFCHEIMSGAAFEERSWVGFSFNLMKETETVSETLCLWYENETLFSAQYVNCTSPQAFGLSLLVIFLYSLCYVWSGYISVEPLPIIGPLSIPRLTWMDTEHCLNGDWQGRTEVHRRKNPSHATSSNKILKWTGQGQNPGLRGDRRATNRLSHGVAFKINQAN
jgi:hypothetical protein